MNRIIECWERRLLIRLDKRLPGTNLSRSECKIGATIRLNNDEFELVSHGKQESEIAWKLSWDFLQQVVENPQEYIDHPEKFDWDWLKRRTGFASFAN